jgi:hypothetical protein
MIILDSQATKLQAKLEVAGTLVNFFGVYADNGAAFTPGQNNVASNGGTYVDVVSAPQSGQRQVKSVYAYNGDTVPHTVTLAHYDGTTARILNIVTLAPGAAIDLIPGRGLYGAITGPTDSTLVQTGTTLAVNLANPNSWGGLQFFTAGMEATWPPYGDNAGWALYYKQNRSNPYWSSLNFDVIPAVHAQGTQTSVLKLTGVEIDTTVPIMYFDGTGYYRFLTELDAVDFMPAVGPGPSGNVLTSNGTAWTSAAPPGGGTDTLATVTARGATTSVASSFTGGLSALSIAGGSTGKMALTPDVADGASALAFKFDTLNTLATSGAIHTQWSNNGAPLMTLDKSGNLSVGTPTGGSLIIPANNISTQGLYFGNYALFYSDNATYLALRVGGNLTQFTSTETIFSRALFAGSLDYPVNILGASGQSGLVLQGSGVEHLGLLWTASNKQLRLLNAADIGTSGWMNDAGINLYTPTLSVGSATLPSGGVATFGGNVGIGTTTPAAPLDVNGNAIIRGPVRLKGYTVTTLPAGTQGDTAYVTDAVSPTYLGTLTGGGTVVTPVFHNGSAWVSY